MWNKIIEVMNEAQKNEEDILLSFEPIIADNTVNDCIGKIKIKTSIKTKKGKKIKNYYVFAIKSVTGIKFDCESLLRKTLKISSCREKIKRNYIFDDYLEGFKSLINLIKQRLGKKPNKKEKTVYDKIINKEKFKEKVKLCELNQKYYTLIQKIKKNNYYIYLKLEHFLEKQSDLQEKRKKMILRSFAGYLFIKEYLAKSLDNIIMTEDKRRIYKKIEEILITNKLIEEKIFT